MFVPHHSMVTASGAEHGSWMMMLHGIYGSGQNWRTFARKLVQRRPDWGLVLVDLRKHGQSQDAPPPHTVRAAAGDLTELAHMLAAQGRRVQGVCGHSFGGKVALCYRAGAGPDHRFTGVIDGSIGPRSRDMALNPAESTVAGVLAMLRTLPPRFASRDEFVRAVEAHGFATTLGQWLAMNLEHRDRGYESRLNPDAMEELLTDFAALDGWPMVEHGPGRVLVVAAGKSSALNPDEKQRLAAMAETGLITMSTLAEAGHWVHVDAPDALLEIVAAGLPPG